MPIQLVLPSITTVNLNTTQQPRCSQLESSLRYAEKALNLALQCHFGEIVCYCRQQMACVTEEIVREGFRNLKLKKIQLVEEYKNINFETAHGGKYGTVDELLKSLIET